MRKKLATAISIAAAAGLIALTGCSSAAPAEALANGDQKDISIAVFTGWPEGEAASLLWQNVLEAKGYNVTLEYADVAPVYTGLAAGDYDLNLDVWLPTTHADYVAQYGSKIVDLGTWNTEASNKVTVNADAPINSLDELAANADLFNNTIYGIEPGAGITRMTQDNVIPDYGLGGMTFTTSSTAGMLSELTAASAAGENFAVTLWHPHWAYSAFDLKDLADPQGAMGAAEGLHSYSRLGFADDNPIAAGWVSGFTMDTDTLGSLENVLYGTGADASDYPKIVADWVAQNQAYVDGLTAS
jgi:glycine betaine/proline transport system substrate-binding protein